MDLYDSLFFPENMFEEGFESNPYGYGIGILRSCFIVLFSV